VTRLLILTKSLGRGGAEQLLVDTVATADRSRFDIEVAYVLRSEDELADALRRLGVVVHCLGARGNWDPSWLVALGRLLHSGRYDVVHAHLPYAAAPVPVLTRVPGTGRPVLVYTEHSLWEKTAAPVRAALGATIGHYDAVIAVSDACFDALPPPARARGRVIVHGVDQDVTAALVADRMAVRSAVRSELGVVEGEVLAVTVANLRSEKGYDVLLDAARQVADSGAPVRFASVGWGSLEDQLERRRVQLGLGDRFRFLGRRDDAIRIVAGADVFVLPSHHEGLPVSLMEAMSVGAAIVATSVGGVPTAVEDGRSAVLVPPGRPDLLGRAVVELAGDEDRRRSLGEAARADSGRFDAALATRRIEALYDELLGARRG
jgi:glycosyltransferase involved in cell wall biosynthesis